MGKWWLWKYLNIPLAILAVAAFVLHHYCEVDGFWINIAAGLITSAVAVNYIDVVVARHTQVEWRGATELIAKRLRYITCGTITDIRNAVGISARQLHLEDLDIDDRAAYFKLCEAEIEPVIAGLIMEMDQAHWQRLIRSLQGAHRELQDFLGLFGHKINAGLFKGTVALQDEMRMVVNQYSVFPDMIGIPETQLRDTATERQIEFKRHTTKDLAKKVLGILVSTRLLGTEGIRLEEAA